MKLLPSVHALKTPNNGKQEEWFKLERQKQGQSNGQLSNSFIGRFINPFGEHLVYEWMIGI